MNYLIDKPDGARNGDFVAISLGGSKKFKQARIIRNYGGYDVNKAASGSILDKYNINTVFPEGVTGELGKLPKY